MSRLLAGSACVASLAVLVACSPSPEAAADPVIASPGAPAPEALADAGSNTSDAATPLPPLPAATGEDLDDTGLPSGIVDTRYGGSGVVFGLSPKVPTLAVSPRGKVVLHDQLDPRVTWVGVDGLYVAGAYFSSTANTVVKSAGALGGNPCAKVEAKLEGKTGLFLDAGLGGALLLKAAALGEDTLSKLWEVEAKGVSCP